MPLSIFMCVKKQRQLGGPSLRFPVGQKRIGLNQPSAMTHDVTALGLFQPLKSKAERLHCLKKGSADVDDVFCMVKKVARGGFSEVWLATYRDRPKEGVVAVKLMAKRLVVSAHVVNEMAILKTLHGSPFIIQMSSNFQTPTHFGIVMKYATGGTLHDRVQMVRRFSELVSRFYAVEIAEGLFVLHNKGIIHRDLNLDNILIGDGGHVLVSDFGLSYLGDQEDINQVLPPWPDATKAVFPSPELLLGKEYDKTVDWWAYGVILYRMICGEYPFVNPKWNGRSAQNYSLEMIFKPEIYPSYISPHAKSLISMLLARRRTQRMGRGLFEENDLANADFFDNVDWCQIRDHLVPVPFNDMVPNTQPRPKRNVTLPFTNLAHIEALVTAS